MPIREFSVFDEFIEYSGPFELKGLYDVMDHFFKNHHYDKFERKHYERLTEDGRYIELDLEPFKFISDFMKFKLGVKVIIRDLKDIKVKDKVVQQADVDIRFRSFIEKNYGELWERNPLFYFYKYVTDKFIYDRHVKRFTDELGNDTALLKEQIKSFLNLYQYK